MRLFESRQCVFKTTTLDGVHGSHTRVIEFDSKPQAKLAGSFACKRDGNDPIDGRSSRTKNSNDTPDQFGRFPRARCRFDNQTLIERFSNPLPRRVVVLSPDIMKCREAPRAGSAALVVFPEPAALRKDRRQCGNRNIRRRLCAGPPAENRTRWIDRSC